MTPLNVLFSSAGRRVELMHCFRRAASHSGMAVQLFACDANPRMSAACAAADRQFLVPRCTDPAFVEKLIEICRRDRVRLLVPTIDTELQMLADNIEKFESAGTLVAVSEPDVVKMARNKLATHEYLKGIGVPSPRTEAYSDILRDPSGWRFPIILKKVDGSSSIGIRVCQTLEDLKRLEVLEESYIAQELWSGEEYTVNLFFDEKRLRCAVPHLRYETRAGEVSKGITKRVPPLAPIIERLGDALAGRAFGPLCFQTILRQDEQAVVFEINARFGGGYPLTDYAGGSFAQWLLQIASGQQCHATNNFRENVKMLRYDAALFIEGEA